MLAHGVVTQVPKLSKPWTIEPPGVFSSSGYQRDKPSAIAEGLSIWYPLVDSNY